MAKGSIRRNILHYLTGQAAIAVFGMLSNAVLARFMSKPDFGVLTYYIAVATIILPILDPGATGLYLRRASRHRDKLGDYWARTVGLKVYSIPITAILLGVYFYALTGKLELSFPLVFLYGLGQSMMLSTDVAFRASERGRSWAIRRTVYEASYLLLTLISLAVFRLTNPYQQLTLAIVALTFGCSWAVITAARISDLDFKGFMAQVFKPLSHEEISALWPFALNNALTIFYYRATAVFIEQLSSPSELANFRVTFIVMISALYIPKALIWASSPRIALHHEEMDQQKFNSLLRQSADINLYISSLITLGGILYGEHLIGIVFGHKYEHLGLLWYIVDLAMGLFFIQQFCAELLNNLHGERHVFRTMLLGIGLLTVLNIALIPHYGAVGAAWARLAAGAIMVPLNLGALAKLVGGENLHGMSLWRFAAINIGAALIGFVLMPVNFWLSLVAFLVSYGALSFVMGAMPSQFDRLARRSLQRLGFVKS